MICGDMMRQKLRNNSGFGLIELTMVIIIIGVLAAVAMQSATVMVQDARRVQTEREMEMLARAIAGDPLMLSNGRRADFGYVGDVGSFPTNLQALYENPGAYSTWDGPYIAQGITEDATGFKTDGWGTLYAFTGGVTIQSSGSGSTLSHKIADAVSDYTLNTLTGTIRDADDSLPGVIYMDSVDIAVTIPNGSGGTATKSYTPDAAGAFALDSLPVGTHPLKLIYTPNVDTLLRYVTILPRHKSPVSFKFASAYFGGGGGGTPSSEVLRPDGAGSITDLTISGCASNFLCVNESSSDDDVTYVERAHSSYATDVYSMDNPAASSGTIDSVVVHCRARKTFVNGDIQPTIYTNSTEYNGTAQSISTSYVDYSQAWSTNPNTNSAWTWAEINNLQAGVRMRGQSNTKPAYCTQVWIEVFYVN